MECFSSVRHPKPPLPLERGYLHSRTLSRVTSTNASILAMYMSCTVSFNSMHAKIDVAATQECHFFMMLYSGPKWAAEVLRFWYRLLLFPSAEALHLVISLLVPATIFKYKKGNGVGVPNDSCFLYFKFLVQDWQFAATCMQPFVNMTFLCKLSGRLLLMCVCVFLDCKLLLASLAFSSDWKELLYVSISSSQLSAETMLILVYWSCTETLPSTEHWTCSSRCWSHCLSKTYWSVSSSYFLLSLVHPPLLFNCCYYKLSPGLSQTECILLLAVGSTNSGSHGIH